MPVGRSIITVVTHMYKLLQQALQGDKEAQIDTQTDAFDNQAVAKFKAIMATMTVIVF